MPVTIARLRFAPTHRFTQLCRPLERTCAGVGCGKKTDGCGNVVDCGDCGGTETCGGAGIGHQCSCAPTSCSEQHMSCGTTDDGCGAALSCGPCSAGSACSVDHCVSQTRRFVQLSAGRDGSCGLMADGTRWCWGNSSRTPARAGTESDWQQIDIHSGQLSGIKTNGATVPSIDGNPGWTRVETTGATTCGLRGGALWCVGQMLHLPVPDPGPFPVSVTPVEVAPGTQWRTFSLNTWQLDPNVHSEGASLCAVSSTGALHCWSQGHSWCQGDGHGCVDDHYRTDSQQIGSANDWLTVDVGVMTCAAHAGGTVECWHYYGYYMPTTVSVGGEVTALASTAESACALRADGSLWCWGKNHFGEVGVGSSGEVAAPARVGATSLWTSITAGTNHFCAMRDDGTSWCWGDNRLGQLGNGQSPSTYGPIAPDSTWQSVSPGMYQMTYAVRDDGTLWRWFQSNLTQVGTSNDWSQVTLASGYVHALKRDGTLLGWTDHPQFYWNVSTWQVGTNHDWARLGRSCWLRTDGSLWCSDGGNEYTPPVAFRFDGGWRWLDVSASSSLACAIRDDQSLWCADWYRQLPWTKIDDGPMWRHVCARDDGGCALANDGAVWCWGADRVLSRVPLAVAATDLSCAPHVACSVGEDGSLWCWGSDPATNLFGSGVELSPTPRRIGTRSDWASIMVEVPCGLLLNGKLYCWGQAAGSDGTSFSSVPSQVEP